MSKRPNTANTSDIVAAVREVLASKADSERAVTLTFNAIKAALEEGKNVVISDFGTFKVVERQARMGRNPQTGQQLEIPAKKVLKFVPSKAVIIS